MTLVMDNSWLWPTREKWVGIWNSRLDYSTNDFVSMKEVCLDESASLPKEHQPRGSTQLSSLTHQTTDVHFAPAESHTTNHHITTCSFVRSFVLSLSGLRPKWIAHIFLFLRLNHFHCMWKVSHLSGRFGWHSTHSRSKADTHSALFDFHCQPISYPCLCCVAT